MAANTANILAGIGSTTAIGSLAYFAAKDTPGPVAAAYAAEVQTITMTATSGTFSLTWNGITVSAQAYNVPTATLQSALNTAWAVPLHAGAIVVSGTAGTSYILTFPAALGSVPLVALTTSALTGGSATIARTTPGTGATMATAPIPAGFTDIGWCDVSGLVANVAETVNKIKGYGSTQILRTIIQDSERTFDLQALETNPTSVALYNRLPLGSLVADSNGHFAWSIGAPNVATYAGIFDIVDGLNHLRAYSPRLQVSSIKSNTVAPGKEITYPLSVTALPDVTGVAIYWDAVVDALHS